MIETDKSHPLAALKRAQPALRFEQVRALWPRHPELVSDVTTLTGWRDIVLTAIGDGGATNLKPRWVGDIALQTLEARVTHLQESERNTEALMVSDLWDAGASFSQIIWLLSTLTPTDGELKRRLRLWSADCIARVLHLFEAAHPYDARVRITILAARNFARAKIDNMKRARIGALAAHDLTRRDAAGLVAAAATFLAREQDSWADNVAAGHARSAAIISGQNSAAETELEWQFDRLESRMSAEEPDDWPLPPAPRGKMPNSAAKDGRAVIGNIPSRLDDFVGREDAMSEMHELLSRANSAERNQIVIVRGAVGKTELVIEYVHRFKNLYSGIWWCPAESRERLVVCLMRLARRMGCGMPVGSNRDLIAKSALENLADRQPPFLLIFDHAVRSNDLKAFIPDTKARCVVTTDQKWVGTSEVVLQSVPNSAAASFLQRVAAASDEHAAKEIAALENCDLAILRTIGDECRKSGLSLRKWLEMDMAYVPYICRKGSKKRG
jgi:hypothetical protein